LGRDGSPAYVWGTTPEERTMVFPCDRFLPDADGEYFRAVGVAAPAGMLFRWLCQLKVAPYSYDFVDNFGRRSPRELTPDAERLARGQRVMTIFEIADFREGEHLTLTLGDPRAHALLRSRGVELRRAAGLGGFLPTRRQAARPLPGAPPGVVDALVSALGGPADDAQAVADPEAPGGGPGASLRAAPSATGPVVRARLDEERDLVLVQP